MKKQYYLSLAPFLLTLLIYWPGLTGALMLDDGPKLTPIINSITSLNGVSFFKEFVFGDSRPVSMASFILNAISSGNNIWQWKLTNVFLHILTGIAVYQFTHLLLSIKQDNTECSNYGKKISLAVAFFWLVHPLQVSTVLYLVQRMTILATLFTFTALTLFVYGFKQEINQKSGKIAFFLSLLFFPLAVFSKQTGILYPVYILLVSQLLFFRTASGYNHTPKNIKLFIQLMWIILLIGFIKFIISFNLLMGGYDSRNFTLMERLITEPRVIFFYLYQILIPLPSHLGFFHDDFNISKDLFTPFDTIISLLGVSSLLILLVIQFKRWSILSLGLLFFLASHSLESTVLPLELVFEHRNYIGLWGVIFPIVVYVFSTFKKPVLIIISASIFLCGITLYRTSIWGNSNIMYPYMATIHPASKRLKIIFSDSYAAAGQYQQALEYLSGLNGLGVEINQLVIQCKDQGQLNNGLILKTLNKTKYTITEYEVEGIIQLANLGLDNHCNFPKNEFIKFVDKIESHPFSTKSNKQKILLYRAHFQYALGNLASAINSLDDSFNQDTSNPIPLFLMVEWLIENNQKKEAKQIFLKAQKIAKASWQDYTDFIHRIHSLLS